MPKRMVKFISSRYENPTSLSSYSEFFHLYLEWN